MHARQRLVAAVLLLVGCAGPTLHLSYRPVWTQQYGNRAIVLFAVEDARPPVITHEQPPEWVGFVRSGFGIPYAVTTASRKPFASQVQEDLLVELKSLGFRARSSPIRAGEESSSLGRALDDPATSGLAVVIHEWRTDAYRSLDVAYRFDVRVIDAQGKVLASEVVQREDTLRGTWGRERYEDAVEQAYAGAIRKVVREDGAVHAALAGQSAGGQPD